MHNTYKTIVRNHAKGTDGLFTRIIGKNSALTIPQKGDEHQTAGPRRGQPLSRLFISVSYQLLYADSPCS